MKPFFSSGITVSRRGSQRSLGGVSRGAFGSRPWPRPCPLPAAVTGWAESSKLAPPAEADGAGMAATARQETRGHGSGGRPAAHSASTRREWLTHLYGIAAALNQGRQPTLLIEGDLVTPPVGEDMLHCPVEAREALVPVQHVRAPRPAVRVREGDPIVHVPVVQLRWIVVGKNVEVRAMDNVESRGSAANAIAVDFGPDHADVGRPQVAQRSDGSGNPRVRHERDVIVCSVQVLRTIRVRL